MTFPDFQWWLLTAAITALSAVIYGIGRGILRRLDNQDKQMDRVEAKMNLELRAMDVRLTVIETQLGIPRRVM